MKRHYRKGYAVDWDKKQTTQSNNSNDSSKFTTDSKKRDSIKHYDKGVILNISLGYPWFFGHPSKAVAQGVNYSTSAGYTANNWIYDIKFFSNSGVINMPVLNPSASSSSVFYSNCWGGDVGYFIIRTRKFFVCPYAGLGLCKTTYGAPLDPTIQETSNTFIQPNVSMRVDYNFSVIKLEREGLRQMLDAEYMSICLNLSYTPLPFNPGSGLRGSVFAADLFFDFYMGWK
jgi:hypothetical protein